MGSARPRRFAAALRFRFGPALLATVPRAAARRAAAAAAVAMALLGALTLTTPAATAAETAIGFDDLAAGTIVTSQYEGKGLKLGKAEEFGRTSVTGDCGAPTVEHETAAAAAASPPNYALLRACVGTPVRGTYGALLGHPRGSLSVEVRSLSNGSAASVNVTTFGGGGEEVAHEARSNVPEGSWTSITVPNPGNVQISYFSIAATTPNNNEVGIDNLGFETISGEHGKEEHKEGGGGSGGGSPPTPPSAKVTLLTPNPHAGEPLTLSGASSQPGSGRIISYGWNFAGGSKVQTSTGTNPIAHLMLAPGLHAITLTVTNSNKEHSSTQFGLSLPSLKIHPPDGGEGECMPTLEVGDAHLLAECIQKLGSGYVIAGSLQINGLVLEPKGAGFLKVRTKPFVAVGGGVVTELYGAQVSVRLPNTPIGDMVLGGRDLEAEPIILGVSGGGGFSHVLFHGLRAPRARAAGEIEKPTKALLMAFGVGKECSASDSKKAECCPPKNGLTACATLPGNFPLTGQVDVYLNNKEQALIDVRVGLSLKDVNFEATGALEIRANLETGIELQSLQFEIGEASLAPIFKVKGASFTYYFPEYEDESKRDSWQAKGTLTFGEEIAELEAELEFKKGEFHSASMKFKANPGVPIYPGIALNEIGASVGVNPLAFGGSLGAKIAELLELELAFKFREATSTELGFFGGEGKLTLKEDEIATLAADVYSDGYVDAQVKFDLHFPFDSKDPVIKVYGEAGFWDEPASGLWQAKGLVYVKLWVISAEVAGLINNQYAAGCLEGEAFGISGGVQGRYRFSDGNIDGGLFAGSHCTDQLKQYSQKPLVKHEGGFVSGESALLGPEAGGWRRRGLAVLGGATPFAAAAAQGDTFKLPAGKLGEELRITSPSGTPVATLIGPGGQRFATPSAPGHVVGVRGQYTAVVAPDPHQVLVLLLHPAGGTWGIQPAAGSPPVGSLEVAEDAAPAAVRVHVSHRRGRSWSLGYSIGHYVAGTRVRFVERGRDSTHVLGTVARASGTLAFTPQEALGRARTLVAYLLDGEGATVRELAVARFSAPAASRPGQPGGVRIARHGASALVTWGSAAGARGYRIRVRGSDGRLETLFRKAGRRSVTIPDVLPFESFTVTVTPVSGASMLRGRPATAVLKALRLTKLGAVAPRARSKHGRR